ATSFFPTKPLGCYGDGGALFTDDDDLGRQLRRIARHGQDRKYHHVAAGVNSRLDTIQAAVLLAKLEIFDDELRLRQIAASRYASLISKELGGAGIVAMPVVLPGNTSAWAQYTIRIPNRDHVAEMLTQFGVPTMVHYPLPLYRQPAFLQEGLNLPISE